MRTAIHLVRPFARRITLMETPLSSDDCIQRLRDIVHSAALAPRDAEVVGSVSADSATITRRHLEPAGLRAVHPSVEVQIALRAERHGTQLRCVALLGVGTIFNLAMFFAFAAAGDLVVLGETSWRITSAGEALGLFLFVGFWAVPAVTLKRRATEDQDFLVAFAQGVTQAKILGEATA